MTNFGTIEFFSLKEFLKTSVKVKNFPETWEQLYNLNKLATMLDFVRKKLGKPIRVNSGYRSPLVNIAVKGSTESAHLKGLAADIEACSGQEMDNRQIAAIIQEFCEFDQLIVYHERTGVPSSKIRFMHIGLCEGKPRNQLLHK